MIVVYRPRKAKQFIAEKKWMSFFSGKKTADKSYSIPRGCLALLGLGHCILYDLVK